jgi:hypothetical protein
MDILNHIFTSGITPTNTIYFSLQAKLPFNNTTFAIRFCKLGAYHAGRILLTQLGSNSTIRLQKHGDSITVHITSSNFHESVVFTLVEAHQLDLQSMPTVEYKPHV